jgi:FkbM family methyltransferase
MIKKLTKALFRTFGYEVRRYRPPVCEFFQTWKHISSAPTFIIDVGANHGNWTRSALDYFPDARYLMIEPQDRLKVYSKDLIQRANVHWLTAGISDQVGSLTLTLPPRDDTASFIMNRESAEAYGYPQIEVPVTTLDRIVEEEQRIPELVKIDAEGFDLRALRGASALLGSTDVFLVECAIYCSHLENSLEAVCAFMWGKGYRVFDFTDLNHSPKHGVLWLSEVVFVRRSSPIWEKADAYE